MNDPVLPPVPPLPEDVRHRALRTVLEGVAAEPARRRSRGRHLTVAAAAAGVVLVSTAAVLAGTSGDPVLDLPPAAPAVTVSTDPPATRAELWEAERALLAACRARPPLSMRLDDASPWRAAALHAPDGAPTALVVTNEEASQIGYCIEDPVLGPAARVQDMLPSGTENRVMNGHVYYGHRVRAVQVPVPNDTVHAEITMGDGRVPTPCTLTTGFATCTTGVDRTASDPEDRRVTVTATTASDRTPVVVWRD